MTVNGSAGVGDEPLRDADLAPAPTLRFYSSTANLNNKILNSFCSDPPKEIYDYCEINFHFINLKTRIFPVSFVMGYPLRGLSYVVAKQNEKMRGPCQSGYKCNPGQWQFSCERGN
jgi:hypothetical protein